METIKSWDEFEEKAIPLIRRGIEFRKTEDFKRKSWKAFIKAFKDDMSALYRAYISGAEDEVDRRLRKRRADRMGLSTFNQPYLFFSSDESWMRRNFANAKAITREMIEEELKEEERQARLQREPRDEKKTSTAIIKSQDDVVMKLIKEGGIATDRRMPIILFGFGGATKNYKITEVSRRVNNERIFTSQTLDILDAVSHKATE
jgi:hypothetical protein